MEYIYGAMLLHKAGKEITSEALTATLKAAGIDVDEARVKATASALKDVDIEKVIAETQIASSAPAAAAPAAAASEAPAAAPAEEEKASASDEEVSQGLGALFG
ncbi:MAG: 50S ribosomal protein P1 [Candidatus Woesearchaeota archaeon]|jgi:large subunit ribosomal protein L12